MSEREPAAVVWDLLRGAITTKALGIVADLRVAEALAAGPQPVGELARATGVDSGVLHRLLRALASDGVFMEEAPGVFANTPASDLLSHPGWSSFAHLFGGLFYRALGDLDRATTTGKSTFADAFDRDFWSWLGEHSEERATFDLAMAGEKSSSVDRIGELDWRDGEIVVDVGGGNGALLVELLRRRPRLRGIVFDLPETDRDDTAFQDGLAFVEGSFFERIPEGDTYVLSGILHDWGDEPAAEILRTICDSAREGARLLILDAVIPPGNGPAGSKWLDVLMLVLAGGRERTESDWWTLLDSVGLEVGQIEDGLIVARCP